MITVRRQLQAWIPAEPGFREITHPFAPFFSIRIQIDSREQLLSAASGSSDWSLERPNRNGDGEAAGVVARVQRVLGRY